MGSPSSEPIIGFDCFGAMTGSGVLGILSLARTWAPQSWVNQTAAEERGEERGGCTPNEGGDVPVTCTSRVRTRHREKGREEETEDVAGERQQRRRAASAPGPSGTVPILTASFRLLESQTTAAKSPSCKVDT